MSRPNKNADLKLNIHKEINFLKILFIRPSLGFCAKQVLKLSISEEINPPTRARAVKYKARRIIFYSLFIRMC